MYPFTKKFKPGCSSLVILTLLITGISLGNPAGEPGTLTLVLLHDSPRARFAAAEISAAFPGKSVVTADKSFDWKTSGSTGIILATLSVPGMLDRLEDTGIQLPDTLNAEGFLIHKVDNGIFVVGAGDAGLMYGGLELAEIIATSGLEAVKNQFQNPYMKKRGTKFNIPLDVRTPSYSDVSDAAQHNIAEMWSFDFWKEYIDNLARYRYNFISLWSLHPFPSLVKVPEYPDIALNDVHRSTVDWKESYSLSGHNFDAPEIVDNYEVLKTISIDEKIEFWRRVMAYGKDRNVDFYFVTWNIFTNGTEGKYGITDKLDNPVTRDYFRQSVKQMFLTYPDLAGIGLTTGENMYGHSTEEKEDWAFATYGQGVLDAAAELPDRKITFIHRQHMTGALDVAKVFDPLVEHPDINFIFSFKYAKAHVYSSVNQVYHQGFVNDIQKDKDLKTIWTLRNDDIYHFRWGAPDYVRDFIRNIPYDVSEGYYYGSDQYIWGREFLNRFPETPRQIEIVKHWYHWMMWGRLGYNPEMDNDRFIAILRDRFPEIDGAGLFTAWQHASMIYPLTTGFHWGALDFQWYIESGQSQPFPAETPSGYHDVNRFITLPPHQGTGYASIPDYVDSQLTGNPLKGSSPLAVAGEIETHATQALDWATSISPQSIELRQTVDDIKTMAFLGLYYAHKISAATNLALFRKDLKADHQAAMLKHLNLSAGYWRKYASLALTNNHNPLWTNRVGFVNWRDTYRYVLYDITANGGAPTPPPMTATPGGVILEAEDAEFETSTFRSEYKTNTGRGYLDSGYWDAKQSVTWTFETPESGDYTLEFRYSLKRQQVFDSPVVVNGKSQGDILFWMTGSPESWVWDRIDVYLGKGKNTIQIQPEGFVLIDHLNVLPSFYK